MNKVQLLQTANVSFIEIDLPLKNDDIEFVSRFWDEYSKEKPHFFNGKILAVNEFYKTKDSLKIEWYESSYAHYLLRKNNISKINPARVLFCSVMLQTESNKILVARMSSLTSSENKFLLPGGNIELNNLDLSLDVCKENAQRELKEEIGIDIDKNNLELWAIKSGGDFNDIGLIFTNKTLLSEKKIQQYFDDHFDKLKNKSEISEILFVRSINDFLEEDKANLVDYLEDIVNLFIK